jgi:predicted RNase H-like HicB family nuclease
MNLRIEVEHEEDGRWIAEVVELPGCLAYGQTQEDALAKVKVLGLRAMADRLEHGEPVPAGEDLFSIHILDLEEDSPELEAELLKAVNGPFKPFHESELREIADRALRDHRARQ